MERIKKYLLPVILLLLVAFLTWLFLIHYNLVCDKESRLTIILALLGISFAVLQFWISEKNSSSRNKGQMRYDEYKHIFSLIESVPNVLNEEMMKNQEINPHSLISTLVNHTNGISAFLNTNDYLFPGLIKYEESKELNRILSAITKRTDEFRVKLENITKEHDKIPGAFLTLQERMDWHNEMRNQLKALHSAKYKFYDRLVKYI